MFSFSITHQDKATHARTGIITTPHGEIQTPAFIPVGTHGTVKSLTQEDLAETGTQIFFANTYHLYLRPGADTVKKLGGLHRFAHWNKPLITDSGGFQVFSLAREQAGRRVKITDDGVEFTSHLDGSKHFFSPITSLEIQQKLGADIILPLDECTYYPATYEYARKAMERTHRWAEETVRSFNRQRTNGNALSNLRPRRQILNQVQDDRNKVQDDRVDSRDKNKQTLYGIVQGGVYEDLRKESAKFIAALPFFGYAIGGVSVGESKKDMQKVCDWVIPHLLKEKPRHLLGVGEIDDIFEIIERGIDTFDCVMPTRLGRMGHVLNAECRMKNAELKTQKEFQMDIMKSVYRNDKKPIDAACLCYVCQNYSRAYIHHLFRARELLAYRLATFHNLHFVHSLVAEVREGIKQSRFEEIKRRWIGVS